MTRRCWGWTGRVRRCKRRVVGRRYCDDHARQPWRLGFIALFTIVPGFLTCGVFLQRLVVVPERESMDEERLRKVVREELASVISEQLSTIGHISLRDPEQNKIALSQVEESGRQIEAVGGGAVSGEEEDELSELQESVDVTRQVLEASIAYANEPSEDNIDQVLRIFSSADLQLAILEFGADRTLLGPQAKREVEQAARHYLEEGRAVSLRFGRLDAFMDCFGPPQTECGELVVEGDVPGGSGRLRWLAPAEPDSMRVASFGKIRIDGSSKFSCLAEELGLSRRTLHSWQGNLATVGVLLRSLLS